MISVIFTLFVLFYAHFMCILQEMYKNHPENNYFVAFLFTFYLKDWLIFVFIGFQNCEL